MRSTLDCIPCLTRQALFAVRLVHGGAHDDQAAEPLLRRALAELADMDLALPPPVTAARLHELLQGMTGGADAFAEAKARFQEFALALLPGLERTVAGADDPFEAAVRAAVAGNVIDLGVKGDLGEDEARANMDAAMHHPLSGDVAAFRAACEEARNILYLADNAGEIVFDRLLLERLPRGRTTVCVRGGPIINDATRKEADQAGIPDLARVIDSGVALPGTWLPECGTDLREAFAAADLIIAKGQGNYETLSDTPEAAGAPVWFLFKVKCAAVAGHSGLPLNHHVVMRGGGA